MPADIVVAIAILFFVIGVIIGGVIGEVKAKRIIFYDVACDIDIRKLRDAGYIPIGVVGNPHHATLIL
jgi:hypothetical protein